MLPDCPEFQSRNVQIFGYVFHDTSGRNLRQTSKILWFILNEICMVGLLWERWFEKSSAATWIGRSTELEMPIRASKARSIVIGTCGWHKNWLGRKRNLNTMWKKLMKLVDLERTDIISWSCILRMYSTWMQIERKYCWGIQIKCSNHESRRSNWKVTWLWDISRENSRLVLWHGGSREEMCGKILRTGKKCWEQLYKVSLPCLDDISSKRKKWKRLENCQKFALKSSWHKTIDQREIGHTFHPVFCFFKEIPLWENWCAARVSSSEGLFKNL